ncbi:hypothetical protein XaC1_521 [Xanthomonas phage XaC1]|nr:hypothetical protein XaC1_521 [Xanthomonas phage XaC1]
MNLNEVVNNIVTNLHTFEVESYRTSSDGTYYGRVFKSTEHENPIVVIDNFGRFLVQVRNKTNILFLSELDCTIRNDYGMYIPDCSIWYEECTTKSDFFNISVLHDLLGLTFESFLDTKKIFHAFTKTDKKS